MKKGPINQQHSTQYNKSFIQKVNLVTKYEAKKSSGNIRNTASIISNKSSKSPATRKPQTNDQKTQERTRTQQQVQIMAVNVGGVSQRQTTRSQIKSDQLPNKFSTKYKSKATNNKNSIISLNKNNEIVLNNEVRKSQHESIEHA